LSVITWEDSRSAAKYPMIDSCFRGQFQAQIYAFTVCEISKDLTHVKQFKKNEFSENFGA
jgi:hypothetical protein